MNDINHAGMVTLRIPAETKQSLVASMVMSGVGLLAGLDIHMIGDLRTVTNECCDCIIHQPHRPQYITVNTWFHDGRLNMQFISEDRLPTEANQEQNLDITRGVLETLMPIVQLHSDENGVYGIECATPV